MIVIVDYGIGNIGSVLNMFKKIGVKEVVLSRREEDIENAHKLLLPGVGAFDIGMKTLESTGLIPVLQKKVIRDKIPIIGICLGMQLLTHRSDEGQQKGLGWIDAETVKFQPAHPDMKIPHMGWNYVTEAKSNVLLEGSEKKRFYFVHSYYVKCHREEDVLAWCDYGGNFACAVQKDNIWGVQFHPEKSHRFGMKLFENFAKI